MGLPGRYNPIGEWKPIVYPGNGIDYPGTRAREITKDIEDKRVGACLLYIIATCHHVIEFVVKSNFLIPEDFISAESNIGKFTIHKVRPPELPDSNSAQNIVVYDGTFELKGISIDDIAAGLQVIPTILNRMAFQLDAKFEWQLKYPLFGGGGKIVLHKEDTDVVGKFVTGIGGPDSPYFDAAIDWFIAGNNAQNPFNKFLSYYISLEGLALKFMAGELEVSKKYSIVPMTNEERVECIKRLHDKIYTDNPIEFTKQAYTEGVHSLHSLTKKALTNVFGDDHKVFKIFKKKENKYNLYGLRNQLAHGSFSLIDPEHEDLIRKRTYDIKFIAKSFISQLALGSEADKLKIKHLVGLALVTSDPRSASIVSDLNMLPRKDWRIRLEWLID